jgi:predicted lysophospholipase L1 biosynthesis ABC-type transport system permease subunit
MLRRDRWGWAAALAAAAVFTRATGFLLVIPFAWAWIFGAERRSIGRAALALSPLAAYLVWRWLFGADFDFVETHYFGRWPLALGRSLDAWKDFFGTFADGDPQTKAYDLTELAGVVAALAVSALLWRRDPALTLYGLAIFAVVATSGAALGMHRYALAMPALALAPAHLGRFMVFDRLWTLACVLGLAALATLFSFGFWAG